MSSAVKGAATAAPTLTRRPSKGDELALADQWEADALDAIERVQDVTEAEVLLGRVATVDQAMRLNKISGDRERRWRGLRLKAERRYGELLGPKRPGKRTDKEPVTSGNRSGAGRAAQHKARQIAPDQIPDEVFDEYVATDPKPTREGLKRKAGRAPAAERKRGGQRTVDGKSGLSHDPEVINWVRQRYRRGWSRDRIVTASERNTDGWPRPDEALTNGGVSECRAVIHHLESQRASWPLREDGPPRTAAAAARAGKRMHTASGRRSAARRAQDTAGTVLWDTTFEVTKLTGLLISLDIGDVELDEHGLDLINDLHDDMLFLQDWIEQTIGAVQGRLGEHGVRQKIKALRDKTTANGCTVEEEATARRMADRLERKLGARLAR